MRLRILAAVVALAALVAWLGLPGGGNPPQEAAGELDQPPERPVVQSANLSSDAAPASVDRAAPSESPPSDTSDAPAFRFELYGVAPGEFRGSVIVYSREDEGTSTLAITRSEVVIPTTVALRKIEFVVPGYCIAEYAGPFLENEAPVRVDLYRAGEIIVEVVDVQGRLLPHRLVYCFPLKDSPPEGLVSYRTTPWATSDERGQARVSNVIPGEYRVSTDAIAEWQEAEVVPVQVSAATHASCVLKVPVLAQDEFGGFVLDAANTDFISTTPAGVVRHYQFWTDDGRPFNLYRIGNTLRCVVPGSVGEVVRGRIEWRNSQRVVQLPSKQSSEFTLTVEAVLPLACTWADAQAK